MSEVSALGGVPRTLIIKVDDDLVLLPNPIPLLRQALATQTLTVHSLLYPQSVYFCNPNYFGPAPSPFISKPPT